MVRTYHTRRPRYLARAGDAVVPARCVSFVLEIQPPEETQEGISHTTPSWWARAAPARRPRCCSPARVPVLVVDRATFPSDTLSTHLIHPPGLGALKRWGLLDRVVATGCPPIDTYAFDFGPFTIAGAPGTADSPVAYCPRRTVLDKLLVDAASEAGAEVREEFTVEDVVIDDGRVVGIRGHGKGGDSRSPSTPRRRSAPTAGTRSSPKAVGPEQYNEKPPIFCAATTPTGAACR